MLFEVSKSSDRSDDKPKAVELNTLEDLLQWVKDNKTGKYDGVIIDIRDDQWTLEIYDDYRE
jgi:predicted membrane-bound spermidine synthase